MSMLPAASASARFANFAFSFSANAVCAADASFAEAKQNHNGYKYNIQ